MSVKRLAVPLCAIVVLLALAGMIELYLIFNPSDAVAASSEVPVESAFEAPREIHLVDQEAALEAKKAQRERERQERLKEQAAADLVETGALVVDGAALSQRFARKLVDAADSYSERVGSIDQRQVLRSGCEIVSLVVALQAEGDDVSPGEIAERYLRIGTNVAHDYLGDPRVNGGGLPPSVVDAANSWAAAQGSDARAFNLTGTSFDGVLLLVEMGYPVLVWTTERLAEPRFSGPVVDGLQWYAPEHCVVVYGLDGKELLVSDSLEGLVRRDAEAFKRIYDACGSKAAFVLPE